MEDMGLTVFIWQRLASYAGPSTLVTQDMPYMHRGSIP